MDCLSGRRAPLALFALLVCAAPLVAHEGDRKARDKKPRWELASGCRGSGSQSLTVPADYLDFPRSGVQLRSWVTLRDFGYAHQTGNSCFGYTAPSGREYAIIGTSRGTCFVEVTDPGAPSIIAIFIGPESLWRDVRTYADKCYAVSEGGGGIQVFDLAQIDAGQITELPSVTSGGHLATHTLAVDAQSGFLYRAGGGSNGIRIYSLTNPAAPAFVGQWLDRYTHEATPVTYTSGPYAGRQIVFACGGFNGGFTQTGIDILDVTNKSNIQLVRRFSYSNAQFSHQGWLSQDKRWFYLNDELDETGSNQLRTRVIDMQNLSSPVEMPSFGYGTTAIDHNLYVRDNRIYQANYRSGLNIFDNTNPTQPTRVAWFDTWPEDEGAQFNSLWNTYPYFPSGTLIGSDLEKGLWVWKVGAPEIDFAFPSGSVPDKAHPFGETIAIDVQVAPGVQLAAGSVKLMWRTQGGAWQATPATHQAGSVWNVRFPATECGTNITWWLTARTATGKTWNWPQGAPTLVRESIAAASYQLYSYDRMESAAGWTMGTPGDTATLGLWAHGEPFGTYAQPEFDHSNQGSQCFFTGQGSEAGGYGAADVDGGKTTLLSPRLQLGALSNPVVSYWRWYSSNLGAPPANEDSFLIEISNDDGATWTTVEQVGPGGPECAGGWFPHQFRVADLVTPTNFVRLRFVASDYNTNGNVEAAIDDLVVADMACPPLPGRYCSGKTNSQGCVPYTTWNGVPSLSGTQFGIGAANVLSNKPGVLFYGRARAALPFQGGTLCAASPLRRSALLQSGGNPPPVDCSGTFQFDFLAWALAGTDTTLGAGSTVNAQFWYRDPFDPTGYGSGLSDALEFTLQP